MNWIVVSKLAGCLEAQAFIDEIPDIGALFLLPEQIAFGESF